MRCWHIIKRSIGYAGQRVSPRGIAFARARTCRRHFEQDLDHAARQCGRIFLAQRRRGVRVAAAAARGLRRGNGSRNELRRRLGLRVTFSRFGSESDFSSAPFMNEPAPPFTRAPSPSVMGVTCGACVKPRGETVKPFACCSVPTSISTTFSTAAVAATQREAVGGAAPCAQEKLHARKRNCTRRGNMQQQLRHMKWRRRRPVRSGNSSGTAGIAGAARRGGAAGFWL